jgi:DnaJ domain
VGNEGTVEDFFIIIKKEKRKEKELKIQSYSFCFCFSFLTFAMSSYYDILCISPQATEEAIRKAYRKQALLFHPDRNRSSDATARFLMILQAYEVLSDKNKRFQYDHKLGDYSAGIYDIPDYQTWKAQKAAERRAEEQQARELEESLQKAFRIHPYYRLKKVSIYVQSFLGILSGLLFLVVSLYLVFITHAVVFFVVLPFICAGGLVTYFSYTWLTDKKKLF